MSTYEKVEDEATEHNEGDKTEDTEAATPADTQESDKEPPPYNEEEPGEEPQQQPEKQQEAANQEKEATSKATSKFDADQTAVDIQFLEAPPTYLIMSIVVLIIFPFHVFFGVNLFLSIMAHRHISKDNIKKAKSASRLALQINGIAILLGIITYIAFFGLAFYVTD